MQFLSLDLNLLRIFDAVMTEQNLTRAASQLAMTQPAVSNALKRLRDSLNDELFIRTAYGVKPTPRAESLWPAVRRALSDLESALMPESFDVKKAQHTFRIAMSDAHAALWLPSLVRSFEREAPGLSARMAPLTTRDPRAMLVRGDVELAVGSFPGVVAQLGASQEEEPGILHKRLYTGKYICVMRRDHPLSKQSLSLDTYCNANHLLVSFSGRARGLMDDALEKLDRKRHILLTVNQFFTAGRIVANSDLITVIPRYLMAATGMSESLISKELPFPTPEVHVDMLWHERDDRHLTHKWLREHLLTMSGQGFLFKK
jgi:DNA-binding transcriptional LysR family regulator